MTISQPTSFPAELLKHRPLVDRHLEEFTRFDSDCPERLREAIRYSLLAPGKRIRPLLVLAATEVCEGELEAALPAACAVEMIHAYSLIHDDLPAMDDDDMRRGRPSCHMQFDEATAILAGDALIPLAFETIAKHTHPPEVAAACCATLAHAAGAQQLVGGQVDDLSHEKKVGGVDALERIHRRKTGALLSVSLKLGGMIAQAEPADLRRLTEFGNHLGLAFQIVDDLLDLRGEQDKMGKRTQKDSTLGKLTYPAVLGEAQSEQRGMEMAAAAIAALEPFGNRADPLRSIAKFVVQRTQ